LQINYIQTFYVNKGKDPFRDSFGWSSPEYHLMGWALSCLQLQKLYGNVKLYANSQAARLLIDTLQLPYSEVNLSLDNLNLIHPDLWALPKVYTYSLQEQPFLHVDGDVFIFEPFNPSLLAGELIAQNVEVATENSYILAQKEFMRQFAFFPNCIKKDFESEIPFQACNAGILGGNNVAFFHEYAAMAFEYINKNAEKLEHINVNMFNVFFEQHLFYALAKEKGMKVNVFFDELINDNGYKHLGNFHETPFHRNYLHLIGGFKRDEFTCIQMAAKLRELYPEYYERIIALFHKKNIRLSPCGFLNEPRQSQNKIDEENNSHLQRLKIAAINCPAEIEKESFQNDFDIFYRQLLSFLTSCHCGLDPQSPEYLHKRDLSSQNWYKFLFADASLLSNRIIVRCPKTEIIESSFNWAGLFNKYYRKIDYYSELKINKGEYINLVVPENTDNGFSLYDIDKIDQIILLFLSEPLSISELMVKMQDYIEDEVLQNHYDVFKNLIFTSLKQLVVKKAIQPFYDNI